MSTIYGSGVKVVSGHQSSYIPWYGFFEKIHKSDLFAIHDTAQFEKKGFLNRNRIKTPQGPRWLTVPLQMKNYKEIELRHMKIDQTQDWQRKHWMAIQMNYAKAPYFEQYRAFFEDIYQRDWEYLHELNMYIIQFFLKELRISTPICYVSELECRNEKKSDFVLALCHELGAGRYYSGSQGSDYLIESDFERDGIAIEYQTIRAIEYPQLFGEHIPHLSMIDMLMNCGADMAETLVKGGQYDESNGVCGTSG
ncbi:WbqC family protein [Bacillus atrophaeus]|uniref:WbqC family protein n=2 Tax=Bacillus atrophaeus TaxID=1452 RepID=UPI002282781F|nr:WbqC family protein [Bacillus atrophaeus]MCY8467143.1 WbqC family protein [Bacillus atrophaeus]MCY8477706.1 WbqC family protein [Bacillus atrophaeus]